MKRKIKYIFIFMFLLLITNVKALALTVSKNDVTIRKGGNTTVELYINTENKITSADFTMVYSTYDIPADFIVNNSYTDSNPEGVKHSIIFDEAKTGKIILGTIDIGVKDNAVDSSGTVSLSRAMATLEDGSTINLNNQVINVKVEVVEEQKEEVKEVNKDIDKNLIDKIDSNIVKIYLRKNIFEYNIEIEDSVKELDLKVIPKEEDTKINISNQKISELYDNKIVITATKGDIKQDYIINVKVKEKKKEKESTVVIDKGEFIPNDSYKSKWIVVIALLFITLVFGIIFSKKK